MTDGLPNQEVDRTIPEAINAQIDGRYLSFSEKYREKGDKTVLEFYMRFLEHTRRHFGLSPTARLPTVPGEGGDPK